MVAGEIRDGGEVGLVWAEGPLTIEEAADFKGALESVLASHAVSIDLGEVAEIDVTCIQLIFSATVSCERLGKRIEIAGLSQAVRDAFEAGGYKYPGITDNQ